MSYRIDSQGEEASQLQGEWDYVFVNTWLSKNNQQLIKVVINNFIY